MNLLNRYFGDENYREQAAHAMRYLASASAGMTRPLPGVLLADEELAVEPTHMTIVGHKDDARARTSRCCAQRNTLEPPGLDMDGMSKCKKRKFSFETL